ncbi:uncharacterized protein LOC128985361 [Macrosteles quadrilineatus]|uniref:uncharacterized protein LOC128985361 n=1 Tax=Macrosteles quadrilineatus TaxID=74068 RepID=UPI0023E2CDE7|nr:uncharacterized protein LOC128985361 [Macrosteles quadrilineatus]
MMRASIVLLAFLSIIIRSTGGVTCPAPSQEQNLFGHPSTGKNYEPCVQCVQKFLFSLLMRRTGICEDPAFHCKRCRFSAVNDEYFCIPRKGSVGSGCDGVDIAKYTKPVQRNPSK